LNKQLRLCAVIIVVAVDAVVAVVFTFVAGVAVVFYFCCR